MGKGASQPCEEPDPTPDGENVLAPLRGRDLLDRAQAYAQAALRDYQHYQGRADDEEAQVQQLLALISQGLAKLPS